MQAPTAPRRPVEIVRFGETMVDDYGWLRDRDDPAVRAHLEAENEHVEAVLADLGDLRERLFEELRARIQESDASAPIVRDGWCYYHRMVAGLAYPIHCRRPLDGDDARRLPVDPLAPPADEQVILDENVLAQGHEYLRVGGMAISDDHRWLAYLVDSSGAELFRLVIRDLDSGIDVEEVTDHATYGLAWQADSASLLYLVPDDAWRPHQVWRHRRGGGDDELLLQQDDERYWMGLGRTTSRDYLTIDIGSKSTSEVWLVEAADAAAQPRLVAQRDPGVEYAVDHGGGDLVILTNLDAQDFRVMTAPVAATSRDAWAELVPHRPGIRVEDVDAFATHLVLSERTEARTQVRLLDLDGSDRGVLAWDEEVCAVAVGANPDPATTTLRVSYTSLTTPPSVIDVNLASGARVTVKRDEVPGYDASRYVSWRAWAVAGDGTRIPISLVRRADVALDGTAACHLYGYGAYEISVDPAFRAWRLSLLDRGAVLAIAHVRGGGEMGRAWYDGGHLAAKPNTFGDFAVCADHLVAAGVCARDRLAIEGRSAGGLLIGATLNLRPDLCRAAVAGVPFVDVLNTMSDPTLPLTVPEYEEWGNPEERAWFDIIRAYSPYDNVQTGAYPAVLATAGLNDPRVSYWEPAKWVARLRAVTTGTRPILLHTEMGAGHGGPSGRYDALRDQALVLAFLIRELDLPHACA